MVSCFDIGMSGSCGIECPLFLSGECDEPQEMIEDVIENCNIDEIKELAEKYDCFIDVLLKMNNL